MGGIYSLFTKYWQKKPERRIIMIGLDGAGKTTLLYQLKLGDKVGTVPTVGFNVETIDFENLNLTLWDIGGQGKIRPLWHHYYKDTDAIVFVLDSADHERLAEAKEELWTALTNPYLAASKLLIFANKQDLPGTRTIAQLAEELRLSELRDRVWYIQGCCATTGEGIFEGLTWLCAQL